MELMENGASTLRFRSEMIKYLERIGIRLEETVVQMSEQELSWFCERVQRRLRNFLGYPTGIFPPLLPPEIADTLLINVGDWRGNTYLGPNTHAYEFEATEYLKEIFQFPTDQNDWGSSCTGSTEAILMAVIYGRTVLKAKTGKSPVVVASKEGHYALRKSAFIAGLDFFAVDTDNSASMDMSAFCTQLQDLQSTPVIVIATCGTTVREGYDPIAMICQQLQGHCAGSYLHIDAALCGFTAPFLDKIPSGYKPLFQKGVNSVSVSLYKAGGSNCPSAMLLGIDEASAHSPMRQHVDYIDATDGTPSGSRNGHPVLAFAMLYRMVGYQGFKKMAEDCLVKAEYLTTRLRLENVKVFHNEGAVTVFMPRPSDEIVDKYTLACAGAGAHVVALHHVTTDLLERFITDYLRWYHNQDCAQVSEELH
jgi:histidine decarboxylase